MLAVVIGGYVLAAIAGLFVHTGDYGPALHVPLWIVHALLLVLFIRKLGAKTSSTYTTLFSVASSVMSVYVADIGATIAHSNGAARGSRSQLRSARRRRSSRIPGANSGRRRRDRRMPQARNWGRWGSLSAPLAGRHGGARMRAAGEAVGRAALTGTSPGPWGGRLAGGAGGEAPRSAVYLPC